MALAPRPSFLSGAFFGLALLVAAPAEAQEGATFQDSSGVLWGVAGAGFVTLTLTVPTAIVMAEAEAEDDGGAVILPLALGSLVPVALGILSGIFEVPVEPALVFQHGYVSGLLLAEFAMLSLADPDNSAGLDASTIVGAVGAFAIGAALGGVYTALRAGVLAHDPELNDEAHFLTWAPYAMSAVTMGLSVFGEENGVGWGLAGALLGIATNFLAVALVEVGINNTSP